MRPTSPSSSTPTCVASTGSSATCSTTRGSHAPGAAVEVTVTRDASAATVQVADRGPGVPADALAHLFDRFYKADVSRHEGSSGLGLAIAAEHAALLGGGLVAENRPGAGLPSRSACRLTNRYPRAMARTWADRMLITDRAPSRRRPSQRGPRHEARPAPTPDPGPARRVRVGDGRPRERRPAGCHRPGLARGAVGGIHARGDAVARHLTDPDRQARQDARARRDTQRSRDDHRPRVVLPRQLHGQPRARPGAARGPEDARHSQRPR